jgi:putative tryptophan/tyrosine transport system substrate-binding protein
MRRREFISLLSGVAAWPIAARAQQTGRQPIVAFVHAVIAPVEMAGPDPISPLARAFVHGLRDFGWIDGRTTTIERRSAEGQATRAWHLCRVD